MDNREALDVFRKLADCRDAYKADPQCDQRCPNCEYYVPSEKVDGAVTLAIAALEQQEKAFDEWCRDCKEYDKEQHCCPRFSKVIRGALDEVEQQRWIPVTEKGETDGNI